MRAGTARRTAVVVAIVGIGLLVWAIAADAHWAERHVFGMYCPVDAAESFFGRRLRWIALAGAISLAWVALELGRALGRALGGLRGASAPGVVLAILAALAVTEGFLRRLHDRIELGEGIAAPRHGALNLARVDPHLGWTYRPEQVTWVDVAGRRVAYVIDADGNRSRSTSHRADPTRPTILITGESIAFGHGLTFEETLPSILERDLHVAAVNLAVEGYGSDQAYLRLVDSLPRFARPVAVVTLFVPSQLRRNLEPWRPHLALGRGGALELVAPASGLRIAKLLDQLPYHSDQALVVTAATLRSTAEAARRQGAYPLFVVTNYGRACLRNDGGETWMINELFTRQGLPYVRVDLRAEDLLDGPLESHPNARGVARIAAAVEEALAPALAARAGR